MNDELVITGDIYYQGKVFSANEIKRIISERVGRRHQKEKSPILFSPVIDISFVFDLLICHLSGGIYVPDVIHNETGKLRINVVNYSFSSGGYLIPTSGSTGEPKIVFGSWCSLLDYLHSYKEFFESGEKLNFCSLTPPSFDPFLREIYTPLLSGHRLVLLDPDLVRTDIISLINWINDNNINVIHLVPTMLRSILTVGSRLDSVKYVMLAGEPLYWKDVSEFSRVFSRSCRFYNLYGPTETTLSKLFYEIDISKSGVDGCVPLGRPQGDAKVIIVDEHDNSCGPYETGEILIRHKYPSFGYVEFQDKLCILRSPFVQNPFSAVDRVPVYRTGDTGYYDSEGNINFTGRNDSIIKFNGIKVSTVKIESAAKNIPCIDFAAVKLVAVNESDTKISLFYSGSALETDVKTYLSGILSQFEIPTFIVKLDKLPLTHSGKIARDKLFLPPSFIASERSPDDDIFRKVRIIFYEILGNIDTSANPSFILSGGQSIDAIQIVSRIKKSTGANLKLKRFFELDTVSEISSEIKIIQSEETTTYPLGACQDQCFSISLIKSQARFREQILCSTARLNRFQFPWAAILRGYSKINVIERAVEKLLASSWAFNVSFDLSKNIQFVNKNQNTVDSKYKDSDILEYSKSKEFLDLIDKPFDLLNDNPIKIYIIEFPGLQCIVLIVNHILASDGNTRKNVLNLFSKFLVDPGFSMQCRFLRYCENLNGGFDRIESLRYWKKLISNREIKHELYLKPVDQTSGTKSISCIITQDMKEVIDKCCMRNRSSLSSFLIKLVNDFVFMNSDLLGSNLVISSSMRFAEDDIEIIGCLTDSVVIPISSGSTLEETHGLIMDCIDHSRVSFLDVIENCFDPVDSCDCNVFPVIFAMQPDLESAFSPNGLSIEEIEIDRNLWIWPLEIYASVNDRIEIKVNYADDQRLESVACRFVELLEVAISDLNLRAG